MLLTLLLLLLLLLSAQTETQMGLWLSWLKFLMVFLSPIK